MVLKYKIQLFIFANNISRILVNILNLYLPNFFFVENLITLIFYLIKKMGFKKMQNYLI